MDDKEFDAMRQQIAADIRRHVLGGLQTMLNDLGVVEGSTAAQLLAEIEDIDLLRDPEVQPGNGQRGNGRPRV